MQAKNRYRRRYEEAVEASQQDQHQRARAAYTVTHSRVDQDSSVVLDQLKLQSAAISKLLEYAAQHKDEMGSLRTGLLSLEQQIVVLSARVGTSRSSSRTRGRVHFVDSACLESTPDRCVPTHPAVDATVTGLGNRGGRSSGDIRCEQGIQRVDELPYGGAVCNAA